MKRLVLIAIIGLVAVAVGAQNAQIKVGYTQSKLFDGKNYDMTLLTGRDASLYFNDTSLYCDSMESTPEGKKRLQEIRMAAWVVYNPDGGITIDKSRGNAPAKKVNLYVAKNFKNGSERVYNSWADENGWYDEPLEEIQWTISDSTATVLGYECVMAQTDYHGRHWEAWFAPEIPLPDGPWKLCGLPGLVLRAESGNDFRFEAKSIEETSVAIPTVYRQDTYSKVDRCKALASEDHYRNNIESMIKAKFGASVQVSTELSEKKFNAAREALELDYTAKK